MADETDADSSTDTKIEQEIEAVANAERDPKTAMAQGVQENPVSSEPRDPVDPSLRETGQDYHGKDTVFTHATPQQEQQEP